jgi:hypothetical protein
VTTTQQLLDQALHQVMAATRAGLEMAEGDVTGQLIFAARQCLDLQTLLEDAGAVIDADWGDEETRTPHELLQSAAAALDAIPADERPTLLAPARAELQTTMAAFS